MKIGPTDDRREEETTEQQSDRFKNVAGTNRFMQCGGQLLFSPIRHSDDEKRETLKLEWGQGFNGNYTSCGPASLRL